MYNYIIYRMKKFSDKTKHSKIYSNTYWGNFGLDKRSEEDLKELDKIVENRNNFIDDYNIRKIITKCPVKLSEFINILKETNKIDHLEIYETNDNNYILLNSPYDEKEDVCPDMEKIYKMYNYANSYIKVVQREELRRKKVNYSKIFFEKNPEKKNQVIQCEICGKNYKYTNKAHHDKTVLHQYATGMKKLLNDLTNKKIN